MVPRKAEQGMSSMAGELTGREERRAAEAIAGEWLEAALSRPRAGIQGTY